MSMWTCDEHGFTNRQCCANSIRVDSIDSNTIGSTDTIVYTTEEQTPVNVIDIYHM